MKKIYLLLLLFSPIFALQAQVKLGSLFQNNMVLQAEKEIRIWGKAKPSSQLAISLGKSETSIQVGKDGKWKATLPKMKYGGPYQLKVKGTETITLKNVMVGEVWFCSGQSNMRWFTRDANYPKREIAEANYPQIRFFAVPLSGSATPKDEVKNTKWEVCSPKSVSNKTAVGYFFGRELHKKLKGVAIGLIDISYGGASISTFMDAETVKNSSELAGIERRNKGFLKSYNKEKAKWDKNPTKKEPYYPENNLASFCFNDMIHPLIPYAVRGLIWYQGETNAGEPKPYVTWYGEYIEMMRKHFQDENMPAYFVQLAGFKGVKGHEMQHPSWAIFRLAQAECLKFKNTGMATAYDIGEAHDIHPRNKQEVGRRLSLLALKNTYEKNVVAEGPTFEKYKVKGDKAILYFSHVGKKLKSISNSPIEGFSYKTSDGNYKPVEAKLIGKNKVEVPYQEAELYYAFENCPKIELFNSANLPMYPFKVLISKPVK